jgi:hypothetical protein
MAKGKEECFMVERNKEEETLVGKEEEMMVEKKEKAMIENEDKCWLEGRRDDRERQS